MYSANRLYDNVLGSSYLTGTQTDTSSNYEPGYNPYTSGSSPSMSAADANNLASMITAQKGAAAAGVNVDRLTMKGLGEFARNTWNDWVTKRDAAYAKGMDVITSLLAGKSDTPSGSGYYPSAAVDYLNADLAEHYGMSAEVAYQEAMSNTAHQREMRDLAAAGLNPVLAARSGGASTFGVSPSPSAAAAAEDDNSFSMKDAKDLVWIAATLGRLALSAWKYLPK